MKSYTKLMAQSALAALMLLAALTVSAYDAPYGSDGIFFQVRAANSVALVRFVSSDRKQYSFKVERLLKGKLPADIKVNAAIHEEAPMIKLVAGELYLVYLRANPLTSRLGIYNLAMSGMSIRHIKAAMAPTYEQVISDYVAFAKDRPRLAQKLLEVADSRDSYLQYSAVRDLTTVIAPSAEITNALALKLKNGIIRDAGAKQDIVEKITRFKLTAYAPVLEGLVVNTGESISVRSASLVSLERMGQTEALRRVAPIAVNDQSGRLRRIGIEVIKPR